MMTNCNTITEDDLRAMFPDAHSAANYLKKQVLRNAGMARTNVRDYFSFVMREETTRERITALPFQQVLYKFADYYQRCVIRMPVGTSKTFTMSGLSMFLLGKNNTTRGAIISASQDQAKKPVGMCRDYIDSSAELRLVFPHLRQSPRESDPWTQSKLVVDRPPGIRDPSLTAVGYHGKLPGSRLNWILVDDILTEENTSTPEQRDAVAKWFSSTVLTRRDVKGAKIVVTNTPWHPEDLTYRLEKAGWPALTVDIEGNIYLNNADDFDCEDIRVSDLMYDKDGKLLPSVNPEEIAHRLTAHDDPKYCPELEHLPPEKRDDVMRQWRDEEDRVPLWPERYGRAEIDRLKEEYAASMHEYYQAYMCRCRDDEAARVKVEWIEKCKAKARERSIFTFTSRWDKGGAFTGVDLGVGLTKKHDRSCVFSFAVLDDNHHRILRIDSGNWKGKSIIEMICEHQEAYGSIVRVETNAAQDYIRQFALEANRHLPIRGMPTGKNKHHKRHGIESIFVEVENAVWLIPNMPDGSVTEAVQHWINAMLYHDPSKHTGDELMASWLAREQARDSGFLRRNRKKRRGSFGGIIGAR